MKQPWLNSPLSDGLFILLPPFLSLLIVALFPAQFGPTATMPIMYWLVLVVFIDVAHVYSTLYRTYFKPGKGEKLSKLLIVIPVCCYITGVILYQFDGIYFWRTLAYVAVFHFIRQQYGFMRLYSRKEVSSPVSRWIDQVAIYAATMYPILFWHFDGARNFNWFMAGDFVAYPSELLIKVSGWLYLFIILSYLIKEFIIIIGKGYINIPRNILIAGTALSWYFGIVYFNGDMAFTTLNVISHGIPYIALIWFVEKDQVSNGRYLLRLSTGKYGVLVFIMVIILLAYIEEGFWDGLVWKEHQAVFSTFSFLPVIEKTNLLALIVPLLALPQATHYVLDGFIWKRSQSSVRK